jgi:GDP/UDP-N,N'-diacetylbacillosamine 2-epimerase (hydrolysing)
MKVKKICVFTGTRAEYGLLYWLIKGIHDDDLFDLQLIVSGMHMSPEFGLTYKQIESDGFFINKKVEILLSSDSSVGVSKSIGLGVISFAECLDELKPDLLIVLGDRFEVFSIVTSAMISRIPVAHFHGGESTEGLIDEPIRHSVTKMSHLHFTSTEFYRNRVIQLGEQPKNVFNVGALGIESINKLNLLNRDDFELAINRKLSKLNLLITFHPVTLESFSSEFQFKELLNSLDSLEDCLFIFTKANADTDGRIINNLIDEYVARNSQKAIAFTSMGQLRYLSALQHVDMVVGNSSSGLLEAPSFKIPTINIGDRQRGRVLGETIISCNPESDSITEAINKALNQNFKDSIKNSKNPYGEGNPSESIIEILKNAQLQNIIKKKFYDFHEDIFHRNS